MNTPVIELKNITKFYQDTKILNNISLVAFSGDIISLIGSSGAGKSTLLRCINLLTFPNEGQILLKGEEISLYRNKNNLLEPNNNNQILKLRAKVGFVFQNFNLWHHRTIIENIIEAPIFVLGKSKQEAIEQAEFLLQKVGLFHKKVNYPHELSGGQQQRIAIARALAMNPEVLLLDEPTSSLDPENVREAISFISSLANEGVTMIIVTHEMSFSKILSNKVMFLNSGRVEEIGTPEEIFNQPKSDRLKLFLSYFLNNK